MKNQWQHSIWKISVWVMVELLLNLLNLDTLGDYSEFVFEQKRSRHNRHLLLCSLTVVPHTPKLRIQPSPSNS